MKPSRELDALIATTLGWQKVERKFYQSSGSWIWQGCPHRLNEALHLPTRVPSFSTDITTAWHSLFRRFIEAGFAAWFMADGAGFRAGCVDAAGRFESEGETEAHAICLAYLKSQGVEPQ